MDDKEMREIRDQGIQFRIWLHMFCVLIVAWMTAMLFFFIATRSHAAGRGREMVQAACQGDFMAYCAHTKPWSNESRACMRSVGRSHQLSKDCVRALVDAGEVSSSDRQAYANHH